MTHLTLQYNTNMLFWQLLHKELFTSRCDVTRMDEFTIILLILISINTFYSHRRLVLSGKHDIDSKKSMRRSSKAQTHTLTHHVPFLLIKCRKSISQPHIQNAVCLLKVKWHCCPNDFHLQHYSRGSNCPPQALTVSFSTKY